MTAFEKLNYSYEAFGKSMRKAFLEALVECGNKRLSIKVDEDGKISCVVPILEEDATSQLPTQRRLWYRQNEMLALKYWHETEQEIEKKFLQNFDYDVVEIYTHFSENSRNFEIELTTLDSQFYLHFFVENLYNFDE